MEEDTAIINTNVRNEKIKNFFINYKKIIIFLILIIIFIIILFFSFSEYKEIQKKKISSFYNSIILEYSEETKEKTVESLIKIVNKHDSTYSPLSLYFILDNKLINDIKKINELFDILIFKTNLEKEIKNLIIYKKALFNADHVGENELLNIIRPLINSKSIWKSHALYLMGEFFYSKNEKQKSIDFFNQLVILENANKKLKLQSQKRLNRDLSD